MAFLAVGDADCAIHDPHRSIGLRGARGGDGNSGSACAATEPDTDDAPDGALVGVRDAHGEPQTTLVRRRFPALVPRTDRRAGDFPLDEAVPAARSGIPRHSGIVLPDTLGADARLAMDLLPLRAKRFLN